MGKFAKWIGGGLGFALGGPLGAILGFVVGSAFDGAAGRGQQNNPYRSASGQPTTGGYVMSLLVLVAAVMKADGKTLKSELNYVRDFFTRNFGAESSAEAIKLLRDILQQSIPVDEVCHQIRGNVDYSSRLQMLHFLFGIAKADGEVHDLELKLIAHIAIHLGISTKDYDSIKAMFLKPVDWAYRILEIEPRVTDDEVKKAYRKMAMKYHPDKVSYLGEDFQKSAKEKFQKVNEAYETIKKERRIA